MVQKWSEQFRWRERVHEKYRDLWDLRIIRKRLPFILKYMNDGETVLEIGAFNRELEGKIRKRCPRIVYKSMDVDPAYPHDYSSFEEIQETFDMVLLFEVIEHLSLEEGRELVSKIYRVLNPGGKVILTTPNVHTPGQYWKDATHLTPYHFDELGGLFLSQKFELLEICRIFRENCLKFLVKARLLSFIFRFLGIDFSESVILAARKINKE